MSEQAKVNWPVRVAVLVPVAAVLVLLAVVVPADLRWAALVGGLVTWLATEVVGGWHRHQWSKWGEPRQLGDTAYIYQERRCAQCNKAERQEP